MEEEQDQTGMFSKRYFILAMFIFLSASSGFQWIEYSIVAHIIVDFYSVSYALVDWTSMIYMSTYILFVIPAGFVLAFFSIVKANK